MTAATMNMPMRIDVSLAELPTCPSPSEERIAVLKERLSTTPTKDPEERAQSLAARTARTALLHKLEIEAKQERAKRANDLVKENRARKLRMEAAAVARASSKIEKAKTVETEHEAAKQAKREAATARRAALFEAVRAARDARQVAREQRQAELAKLEVNASSLRTKKLESTVGRSAARVKHALQVAAGLKEKTKEEAAAAAAALADRLSAASSRRQERLAATVEGAASVVQSAEKVRLRHLYDEKAAIEERRARLAKAMDKALSRREAKLESITTRVAAENARVADVVAESRLSESTTKPAAMRHALTARLQAAEVRRLEALHKLSPSGKLSSSRASSRQASRQASLEASPKTSPAASPSKAALPATWSPSSLPVKMPLIIISTEGFGPAAPPPSSQLLSRLHFRPRVLLATAPARHAAAAGRRQTRLNLIRTRAGHFGTVRVAVVRGRRAALAELCRAVAEVRVQKAADRAALHLRAKARTAARLNERVNVAKVKRSNLRLRMLNAAIAKEEKRLAAQGRYSTTLTLRKEGRWEEAKTFAVRVRRAAAQERLITRGAELLKRCLEATARREALLSAIASRAAVRCLSSLALQRAATHDAKTADAETADVEAKPSEVKAAEVKADEAKPATKAEGKQAEADVEAKPTEENEVKVAKAEENAEEKPAASLETLAALPITDVDARIAELRLLLQRRLQRATTKSEAEAEGRSLEETRADLMRKAAAVSAAGAAKAEAQAEAKRAARASAKAVKASVDKAAAMAGLQGREAKRREAIDTAAHDAVLSISSSTFSAAASDTEDWHEVD